jgi:glycine/D-amino acid oxidase-like deaminating enzyme
MPQIGQAAPGLWHAVGFGGHGVAPTTLAGEILAEAIGKKAPLPPAFADYGLSPTYGILGLMAAQASYGWAAFQDFIAERF